MDVHKLKKHKKRKDLYYRSLVPASSTEKYIHKVILGNSPYLEKGRQLTKKYLNPYYEEPKKERRLPEIKMPGIDYRSKSSEPRDKSRDIELYKFPLLPKVNHTVDNKYKEIKARYLTNSLGRSLFDTAGTTPKMNFYFYDICKGNNGDLIRKLVSNRSWWKDANAFRSVKPPVNFIWTQRVPQTFDYDTLIEKGGEPGNRKCINRYEKGYEINEKDNLYRNLWHFFSEDHSQVNEIVPTTFSFRMNEVHFRRDLQQFCRFFVALKAGVSLDKVNPIGQEKDKEGNTYDVYYRFDNKFGEGSEKAVFENFKAEEIVRDKCLYDGKNIWMLKPSGLNRGKGLELFTSLEELDSFLDMFSRGYEVTEFANMEYNDRDNVSPSIKAEMNKDRVRTQPLVYKNSDFTTRIVNFVIQKYIEKPLLFKGHKFDLRVFVFLSHERELFVFNDCYVRLSSLPYDPDRKNYLIHLTNHAVQVRSNSYGSLVKGNIISIRDLEEYLITAYKQGGPQKYNINSGYFMSQIKEKVKPTMDACFNILENKERKYTFELFGYDFMIDDDLKLWLLEVNSIPALGESNHYLSKYLARALDDMFKLTLDKIFTPPSYAGEFLKSHQDFYPMTNTENLWHKIGKYSN